MTPLVMVAVLGIASPARSDETRKPPSAPLPPLPVLLSMQNTAAAQTAGAPGPPQDTAQPAPIILDDDVDPAIKEMMAHRAAIRPPVQQRVVETPTYKKWWFWALTAAVVGGAAVLAASAITTTQQPPRGCIPGALACFGDGRGP